MCIEIQNEMYPITPVNESVTSLICSHFEDIWKDVDFPISWDGNVVVSFLFHPYMMQTKWDHFGRIYRVEVLFWTHTHIFVFPLSYVLLYLNNAMYNFNRLPSYMKIVAEMWRQHWQRLCYVNWVYIKIKCRSHHRFRGETPVIQCHWISQCVSCSLTGLYTMG